MFIQPDITVLAEDELFYCAKHGLILSGHVLWTGKYSGEGRQLDVIPVCKECKKVVLKDFNLN